MHDLNKYPQQQLAKTFIYVSPKLISHCLLVSHCIFRCTKLMRSLLLFSIIASTKSFQCTVISNPHTGFPPSIHSKALPNFCHLSANAKTLKSTVYYKVTELEVFIEAYISSASRLDTFILVSPDIVSILLA